MTTATLLVMKQTDETRGDGTAALDTELFLDLEAGSAYWIEAVLQVRAYYSSGGKFKWSWQFDGTLYEPGMHVQQVAMPAYYTGQFQNRALLVNKWLTSQAALATVNELTSGSDITTGVQRAMVLLSGRITTSTAGRLALSWQHSDSGSASPTTVFAGSWIYATPLDICPI